jgi:hypothetical protein
MIKDADTWVQFEIEGKQLDLHIWVDEDGEGNQQIGTAVYRIVPHGDDPECTVTDTSLAGTIVSMTLNENAEDELGGTGLKEITNG